MLQITVNGTVGGIPQTNDGLISTGRQQAATLGKQGLKRQPRVRTKTKPFDTVAKIPQQHRAIVTGGREGRGVWRKIQTVDLTLTSGVDRVWLECRGVEQTNLAVRSGHRHQTSIGGVPHKVERSLRTKHLLRGDAGLTRKKVPFKAPEICFPIARDMPSEEFTHSSHVVALPGLTGETHVSHIEELTRMLSAVLGTVAILSRLTKCHILASQQLFGIN